MILVVLGAEVIEHVGLLRTAQVIVPLVRMHHGVEHLSTVLHVLRAFAKTGGKVVLVARTGLVGFQILVGKCAA